jgi:hypothetical protein
LTIRLTFFIDRRLLVERIRQFKRVLAIMTFTPPAIASSRARGGRVEPASAASGASEGSTRLSTPVRW